MRTNRSLKQDIALKRVAVRRNMAMFEPSVQSSGRKFNFGQKADDGSRTTHPQKICKNVAQTDVCCFGPFFA